MRASEILRGLADMLDAREGQRSPVTINNRPDEHEVEVQDIPSDTQGIEGDAQVNVKTMVPPLQQKIDLMKKLAGLEHSEVGGVDEQPDVSDAPAELCITCNVDPCSCEPRDELAIMKQNAGLAPFIMMSADEDPPFEV